MCSDHIAPWGTRQGHSGYAWSWLGAALATTDLELGCVCAPGQRYHPAVVAQKIATLGRDVPRTVLDGARQRGGQQRAHHRRPLATEGGTDAPPGGVRRRDPSPPRRRGGHPRRPRHRRPRPAVGPAGRCSRGSSAPRCRSRPPPAWRPGPTGSSRSTSRSTCCATSSRPTATPAARARCRSRCTCRGRRRATRPRRSRSTSGAPTSSPSRSTGTPRPREAFDVMAEHVGHRGLRTPLGGGVRGPRVAPRPDRRARVRRLRRRLPALRRTGAGRLPRRVRRARPSRPSGLTRTGRASACVGPCE